MSDQIFITKGGIEVTRSGREIDYLSAIPTWVARLDNERGAVFSSNYEYPGRYTRWDVGIVNPPIVLECRGRQVTIEALNGRGRILLEPIAAALDGVPEIATMERAGDVIAIEVNQPSGRFPEEMRSRQPTVFSVIRHLISLFSCDDEALGLYGAFGYDLAFQFEPIKYRRERAADQRDLVLYLPDEVVVVDHHGRKATVHSYEFRFNGSTTSGRAREGISQPFVPADRDRGRGDHQPGEYAEVVRNAKDYFRRGDLFEVVPGQVFYERCRSTPSAINNRLAHTNPSPYSFMINLGANEYLVGASPEMFVRVSGGRRVETCPISGTIARGKDAIEDEAQIRKLLNSKKDEAELTMCSDVDRNDKSRICLPGSVRVIGRRQIEMYSRLIHTVDHIEGFLRRDMDALDAFLSHAWAVTVTGAPKAWAMDFLEANEKSPRAWYGGAIGMVNFNGNLNTGLTLRTVRIVDGIAEIRAGATLLYDSDPREEESETELKASAMIAAIREAGQNEPDQAQTKSALPGQDLRVLLVDHEDSFVHTLADYFRQTGAQVATMRSPIDGNDLDAQAPDLVVLSPGPGRPSDFDCRNTIAMALERKLPVFGVCLGLQALAEFFGARLAQLEIPMHGKPSQIEIDPQSGVFAGFAAKVTVGRYHSLHARRQSLPEELRVTASSADGIVMAFEHRDLPIAAVQFHPESIMTLAGNAGLKMIENVVTGVPRARPRGRD
jgi:anthranilate synthase